MTEPEICTIATTTHGRYLVARPGEPAVGTLLGFHGYAENAETHLEALRTIPGAHRWLLVAVQALHPFYTRDQRVVASWMTSQNRELAIADNIEYVRRIVDAVVGNAEVRKPCVFAGFSQGAAMAYRAAARCGADGVIVLAGDVPPDVAQAGSLRLPPILIGRGTTDTWYTAEKLDADVTALQRLGVPVDSCVFEGGHEWTAAFREAAATYLRRLA